MSKTLIWIRRIVEGSLKDKKQDHTPLGTRFPYDPLSSTSLSEYLDNDQYIVEGDKEDIARAVAHQLKKEANGKSE